MSKPVSGKSTRVWSLVRPAEVWGKHEVLRFIDENFALTDDNDNQVQCSKFNDVSLTVRIDLLFAQK